MITLVKRAVVAKAESLLRSEIVEVTGCTEPATVAFAFLTARNHLAQSFDPSTARAMLTASSEVLRNASTAVVPFLNRRGLRTVVAAGLSSTSDRFNLFPGIDRRVVRTLLRRRSWLKVGRPTRQKGVYVKAILSTPAESVSVTIEGRHDEIRAISRNGRTIFTARPLPQTRIGLAEILAVVAERDSRLEAIARRFVMRQVRGHPASPLPDRMAALIRARMCGSSLPVMTIVGSGNHGILLAVPFHEMYRKRGRRILPAVLFSLLTAIHMTEKRSRISGNCGLATKAGPALAAGWAYAAGASPADIVRLMNAVPGKLNNLHCHGARASCGDKAARVIRVVMDLMKPILQSGGL